MADDRLTPEQQLANELELKYWDKRETFWQRMFIGCSGFVAVVTPLYLQGAAGTVPEWSFQRRAAGTVPVWSLTGSGDSPRMGSGDNGQWGQVPMWSSRLAIRSGFMLYYRCSFGMVKANPN